jgi:hypothetical protein
MISNESVPVPADSEVGLLTPFLRRMQVIQALDRFTPTMTHSDCRRMANNSTMWPAVSAYATEQP